MMKTDNPYQHLIEALTPPSGEIDSFIELGSILRSLDPQRINGLLLDLLHVVRERGSLPAQREGNVYLCRTDQFSLMLRFSGQGGRQPVYTANEFDAFVLNLSPNDVHIPRLECGLDRNNLHQRPPSLKRQDSDLVLKAHDVYDAPAFGDIIDIAAATPIAPLLIVHSPPRAHSTWTFDRDTLEPLQQVSTDLHASRMQMVLQLLQAMQQIDGLEEPLAKMVHSNMAGFARWDALKLLHRCAPQQALTALHQMAHSDRDASLREAARATLARTMDGDAA